MSLLHLIDQTNRDFLTVPLEDDGMETIESLVHGIEAILSKQIVVTIAVGDRRLTMEDWDRTVDYYLLDGDVWSVTVRASQDSQHLFIRTPSRTRTLEFHPSETVQRIKVKFEEKERVPCSQQRLMYAGTPLRDERTLSEYGIHRDCTIDCNIELPGGSPPQVMDVISSQPVGGKGVPFADIKNSSGWVRLQWSSKAPKWRRAKRGLCIEGICKNKRCPAYKQLVIMNLEFNEFDLIEDSHECKCPICKQHITPFTFGVNNCEWNYVGRKVVSSAQRPVTVRQDWKVADDAYHTFNVQTGGKASWLRLKIRTRSPEKVPKCAICLANITNRPEKLSCGHKYHVDCIDYWRADNISCPICKAVQLRNTLDAESRG